MPLDQTWAVGGGAENSVEGARLSLYASTNGGRGVILPGDMRVSALPTPGPFVRAVSGGCVSPNDYLGVDGGGQSYAGREISSSDIPVAPTGSSGGQVKYLIWAVHDEQYEDDDPADPEKDLRNEYEWVSTLNGITYPHVPLVKLDQPANTATITQSMLTDIRELAQPKMWTFPFSRPRVAADSSPQNVLTARNATGGEFFPGGAGYANEFKVPVPAWASRMVITPTWHSIEVKAGKNSWGTMWMEYGTEYRDHGWPYNRQYEFGTQSFFWNTVGGSTNSYTMDKGLSDNQGVPNKLKGKLVTFVFKASVSDRSDAATGALAMGPLGGLSCNITFLQEPLGYEGA